MNVTKEIARDNARKLGIPDSVDIPDLDVKFRGAHNRQDYQKRFYPDFYDWIIRLYPQVSKHAERMYLFANGMAEPPHCPECGKYAVFNSNHKYSTYCSKACGVRSEKTRELARTKKLSRTPEEKAETLRKRRRTNLERYGTENPMELETVKEKQRRTTFERYGVEFSLQSEEVREKGKRTCLERYGTENPVQSKQIQEKIKHTMVERYGVDNASKSDAIKEKKRDTLMQHYGVSEIMQSEELRKRQTESTRKHYGVDNPFQSEEIKNKIKSKNQQLYGCDWNCQRIENRKESEPNRHFREILEKFGIDHEQEFSIGTYIYDFKVGDVLFEISPSITHNSDFNPFGGKPVSETYHQEKCLFAKKNGYSMVEIWDWDNPEEVLLKSVKYKYEKMEASEFEACFVPIDLMSDFICIIDSYDKGKNGDIDEDLNYWWRETLRCDGPYLVGLHKDGTLYSAMVVVPENGLEIKLFETIPGIEIVGGLRKMVEFILENSGVEQFRSTNTTLDLSKNEWKEFLENGFSVSETLKPNLHIYSLVTHKSITGDIYRKNVDDVKKDVVSEIVRSEFDKFLVNENISDDELTEEEINNIWMNIENEVVDLESTKDKIKERVKEFEKNMSKEKPVRVYDCGTVKLVFDKPN